MVRPGLDWLGARHHDRHDALLPPSTEWFASGPQHASALGSLISFDGLARSSASPSRLISGEISDLFCYASQFRSYRFR
jgi:hypothetical protein